ncbi:MAG TPA: DUF1684 domain-containing protein [Candidatus Sulfotelmatobacter sp.]
MRNSQLRSFATLFSLTISLISPLYGQIAKSIAHAPDGTYIQSFDKWKAELIDDLKENWLPLAGLYWLKPGANTFGSASDNAMVFPKGPAHCGGFDLAGKDVVAKFVPDLHALVAGKVFSGGNLDPDLSGHPTVIEMGSLQFHVIVRGERVGIRLKDSESDAAQNFRGLTFYPLDMNYRVTAKWIPSGGKQTIEIPNVLGDVSSAPVLGKVTFKIGKKEGELTDLGGDPAKGLFFVFNDLTAKTDTYPGGRFLETGPVMNGNVELDFNRAYNPPCAVTPYATCPLAPKENRLAVAIPAGEKFDKTAHAHH